MCAILLENPILSRNCFYICVFHIAFLKKSRKASKNAFHRFKQRTKAASYVLSWIFRKHKTIVNRKIIIYIFLLFPLYFYLFKEKFFCIYILNLFCIY